MSERLDEMSGLEKFTELAMTEAFKARDEWKNSGTPFNLPGDAIFRKIIKECFWSSLLQEEGRNPKFKILFCERGQIPALLAEASRYGCYYEFQKPLEGSSAEILKTAVAVSHSQSLICITTDKRGTRLLIHGLLNVGSLREKFFLNGSKSGTILPGCLIFASNAPGHLNIHLGDRGIVGFDRGVGFLSTMDLQTSPILMAEFSTICDEIRSDLLAHFQVDTALWKKQDGIVELYIKIIDEIIFNIYQKRHGGILLLIPEHLVPLALGDLKLRNSLKQANIWNDILSFLATVPSIFADDVPFKEQLRLIHSSISDTSTQHQHPSKLLEILARVREFTDFVASLSQLDGAVIMTTKFNIVGYGTEIRVNDRKIPPAFLQTGDKREPVDPLIFGTRHRSTIRFCRKFPSSLGFVFSQDGGIKAIKGQKDQVTIFPEINRMRFEFFV